MTRKLVVLILMLVVSVCSINAYARKRYTPYRVTRPRTAYCQRYQGGPATKLVSGITEVALSWTEIPTSIIHYSEEYDPVSGLLLAHAPANIFQQGKDSDNSSLNLNRLL